MIYSRARQATLLLAAGLLAGSLLSACGQKGPLYLPDKQQQQDSKAGNRK